jgi:hypothetical protein
MAILVEWARSGPKEARLLAGLPRHELAKPESCGREVLLVFEEGNAERPIIVGLLADPLDELIANEEKRQKAVRFEDDVVVDGKRLMLEAHDEIELKCGDASITLRKDGKVIIRGKHVVSSASGPNRIRGGSVQIN